MYRIVLVCEGVSRAVGEQAASDITDEFAQHRTWHLNAVCRWDGSRLVLSAENAFDTAGAALLDEFGDCVAAYVDGGFGPITVESVVTIGIEGA